MVLPSVGAAVGHRGSGRTPRIRVLAALANVLATLSLRSTLVVVLDDVHLADGSSWEALHFLAGSLAESRILLVLTARPAELLDDAVATGVVHALEQEGVLARRTLGPLSADGIRELAKGEVGDDVPRALVDWLMDRSRGVPLFALGLLRALLEEDADLARPVLRELPEDLSQRIRARLARLAKGDRSTLELIAALGYRVRISDLVTLTGSADAELTDCPGPPGPRPSANPGRARLGPPVRGDAPAHPGGDLSGHRCREATLAAPADRADAGRRRGARHGRAALRPLGRSR